VYDLYQHKAKRQYRLLVPQGAALPPEAETDNWNKVKATDSVTPEAKDSLDRNGYYLYKYIVTFKELST
jgi:hypothetical protein